MTTTKYFAKPHDENHKGEAVSYGVYFHHDGMDCFVEGTEYDARGRGQALALYLARTHAQDMNDGIE